MPDELERACDEAAADGRRVVLLYVIPVRTLIAIIGTLIAIIGTLIAIIGAVRHAGTTRSSAAPRHTAAHGGSTDDTRRASRNRARRGSVARGEPGGMRNVSAPSERMAWAQGFGLYV